MVYFGYPLDILGEKPNPKSNPIGFRAANPKNIGDKSSPNPNP
jgi:hypothetical protein